MNPISSFKRLTRILLYSTIEFEPKTCLVCAHVKYFKWIIQKYADTLAIVIAGVEVMDGF